MAVVRFAKFTEEEQEHVRVIVDYACQMCQRWGLHHVTRQDVEMDLSATHATVPLQLEAMAARAGSEDVRERFDLNHDLAGIFRHLDRRTGELRDHFLPRFAVPAEVSHG